MSSEGAGEALLSLYGSSSIATFALQSLANFLLLFFFSIDFSFEQIKGDVPPLLSVKETLQFLSFPLH
jgi:hypothetical protein